MFDIIKPLSYEETAALNKADFDRLLDETIQHSSIEAALLVRLYKTYGDALDIAPDLVVDHPEWSEFVTAQMACHEHLFNILWSMK